jgi:hypothetical protein
MERLLSFAPRVDLPRALAVLRRSIVIGCALSLAAAGPALPVLGL